MFPALASSVSGCPKVRVGIGPMSLESGRGGNQWVQSVSDRKSIIPQSKCFGGMRDDCAHLMNEEPPHLRSSTSKETRELACRSKNSDKDGHEIPLAEAKLLRELGLCRSKLRNHLGEGIPGNLFPSAGTTVPYHCMFNDLAIERGVFAEV
eukprot:1154628-Pelagomonas_calceolata.AAC.4